MQYQVRAVNRVGGNDWLVHVSFVDADSAQDAIDKTLPYITNAYTRVDAQLTSETEE